MRDRPQSLQSDLGSRAFHGVNRAEQLVDFFGVVISFEREQAVAHNLQMLFGFRLEEFQDLGGYVVVQRQGVKIGSSSRRNNLMFRLLDPILTPCRWTT